MIVVAQFSTSLGEGRQGAGGDDQRGPDLADGEKMLAPRGTARHLDIDEAIGMETIALHHLPQDAGQRRPVDRPAIRNSRRERSSRCEVLLLIGEPAAMEMDDFIDAVAELEAAILDPHLGGGQREIATVHIGDAAHSL